MNNEYHAVVHLFGKNSSDKQEIVRTVIPGQEIEIGLDLYREVNRILNFYGVNETGKFLGRVAFGESLDMATAGSDISYMTKEEFYRITVLFLNLTIIETINKKLILDKKPLLIPESFTPKGYEYNNDNMVNMFTKTSEFYEFSKAFGAYTGETESGVTWIPPLNVYIKETDDNYIQIIKSWIFALQDAIHNPEIRKELDFSQSELKFIDAFIKQGKDLDISGRNPNHEGELMRWIMDKAIEQEGIPTERTYNLLLWTNHYNR